ncbi:MAG TPA: hypothetical protein VL426_05115 [Candidatus Binatia bacterium]|jgi:hypothetical protein|nr:hypothetical protein [Candidatus Binatia bacterium]
MRARSAALLLLVLLWLQLTLVAMTVLWGSAFIAIFVALFSLLLGTFFATTAYSVLFGAPYVPTDEERVASMLRLADLKPGERLYDLGSGDGRIVIAAARQGAYAEGWEISPYLWLISWLKIRRLGLQDRARVRLGTYWGEKFNDADVVTLFLITMQMGRMEKKLREELRPGSRVVSYAFDFPRWQHDDKREGIYLYRQD